jgi:signal transduction histidine kinase
MKNIGIHVRLLLAVFILIAATTFTLGYMGSSITYKFVRSRFEERIMFLARYLALNAELGILIDERAMLKRLAGNLLSEKDVVQVTIFNRTGEILADEGKAENGGLSVVEVPVVLKETQEESQAFLWNSSHHSMDEMIGKVRITYSTEGINRLLTTMEVRYTWLASAIGLLAVLLFYFISRSLVAPVTRLADAARKVEKGDLKLRAEPGSMPETRKMVLAFNAMLDSLEKSRKALEKANQEMIRQKTLAELGKFSLMIAHEVKNPLSIIKSSLDILKKDIPGASENTMVSYIEDEVRRLNRLIEDFLLFARPARPNMREVDANAMAKECVDRFEFRTVQGSVKIERYIPDTACYIKGDRDLLHRAIGNMLKNAIESHDDNGRVIISAGQQDDCWHLEVSDEGRGIDPENMEKIFEPFFTTRSRGTGLGLAFVYQVVTAHGGEIGVENRPDTRGAVFRAKIPLEDQRPEGRR